MFRIHRLHALCALWLAACLGTALSGVAFGQRTGYSRDEFVHRRDILMTQVKEGVIILFGEVAAIPGGHFLQDNDFFYFTGVDDAGAICLMIPASRRAVLFLPQKTDREKMVEGPNLLDDPASAAKMGFADILPVNAFDEYVARKLLGKESSFHLRLSPRDSLDEARTETAIYFARRIRSPYNDQTSLDGFRIAKLRERYPGLRHERYHADRGPDEDDQIGGRDRRPPPQRQDLGRGCEGGDEGDGGRRL